MSNNIVQFNEEIIKGQIKEQTHVGIGYRMLKNGWRLRQFMDKL